MTSGLPTKTDKIGRRSRFQRQPTGKRIMVTKRDMEIFRLLSRYRFVSSDRIISFFDPRSPKRLIERLGDLYHEAYLIDRPAAQWRRAKSENQSIIYELTKSGLEAYAQANQSLTLPNSVVNFGGAVNRRVLQFDHANQISQLMFDIEQLIGGIEDQRLITELEILQKASAKLGRTINKTSLNVIIPASTFIPFQRSPYKTDIVPDALFGVEHRNGEKLAYRFYALEVERKNPIRRRTLDKPSTLKKLLAYQALINSNSILQQLSLPNLFLIIATETPDQLTKIMEMADQTWSKEEQKFLLIAPPDKLSGISLERSHTNLLFAEICEKWYTHFSSS